MTLPGFGLVVAQRRSRFAIDWSADDLGLRDPERGTGLRGLVPRTNQTPTLDRTGDTALSTDRLSQSQQINPGTGWARWSSWDLDNDGIRETVGLGLANSETLGLALTPPLSLVPAVPLTLYARFLPNYDRSIPGGILGLCSIGVGVAGVGSFDLRLSVGVPTATRTTNTNQVGTATLAALTTALVPPYELLAHCGADGAVDLSRRDAAGSQLDSTNGTTCAGHAATIGSSWPGPTFYVGPSGGSGWSQAGLLAVRYAFGRRTWDEMTAGPG